MAAELLPYVSDPSSHKPAAAAATATRRVSWSPVAILVLPTVSTALSVRRALLDDDRGGIAFLIFCYLNMVLLICALRRGTDAPLGSPARRRAKLAMWLLATTLTAAFMWRAVLPVPLGLAVAGWVVVAVHVGGLFYFLVLRDDEKPSESLIMRDCERDGADLAS